MSPTIGYSDTTPVCLSRRNLGSTAQNADRPMAAQHSSGVQWQLVLSANSPSTSMALRKLPHSEIFASSGSFCAATGLTDFSAFREWMVAWVLLSHSRDWCVHF